MSSEQLDARMQAAVDQVLAERPNEWLGRRRTAVKPLHEWLANVAYWIWDPDRPVTIAADDEEAVDAWLRMHAAISFALAAEAAPPLDPSRPRWPLPRPPAGWGSGAAFGARRPARKSKPHTRYHCGVDLDADRGEPVLAPEAAKVLAVDVGWEAPTVAVVLHLDSGDTLLLGGVRRGALVGAGDRVAAGQPVAEVEAYPLGDTMCHVQLYRGHITLGQLRGRTSWSVSGSRPTGLLDPTEYLQAAAANSPTAPADAFVGWLPQEHERVPGETVAGYIARRTGCAAAARAMSAMVGAAPTPKAARIGL